MNHLRTASVLAAVLLLASGCGETPFPTADSGNDAPAETTAAAETTEPAPADTTAPASAPDDVPALDGYDLLWHDEFDGDKLDMSIWSYDPHEPGWTNEEL